MDLHRPVLVGWQASKAAQFVRRHRWFFESSWIYPSFFMIFGLFLPIGLAIVAVKSVAPGNPWVALLFLIVLLGYFLTAQLLIMAALEVDDRNALISIVKKRSGGRG